MPATAGSTYQITLTNHIAGVPPGADPQRSTETFDEYKARMAALYLSPDIDDDESDSDYVARLASYEPAIPYHQISSSYALVAETENAVEVTAQTASYILGSGVSGTVTTAKTGSYVLSTAISGVVTSASHALTADNAAPSSTASYLSGGQAVLGGITDTNITITNTTGTGIDVRTSTTGRAIYAQSLITQAMLATQAGTPSADINTQVLQVMRSIADLNGNTASAALFDVTDQYALGDGPLITGTNKSTEVFKVDLTGSLYSSGSKGYTGTVNVTNGVTMSFRGGIITSVTA
jgi:hypothetical protein